MAFRKNSKVIFTENHNSTCSPNNYRHHKGDEGTVLREGHGMVWISFISGEDVVPHFVLEQIEPTEEYCEYCNEVIPRGHCAMYSNKTNRWHHITCSKKNDVEKFDDENPMTVLEDILEAINNSKLKRADNYYWMAHEKDLLSAIEMLLSEAEDTEEEVVSSETTFNEMLSILKRLVAYYESDTNPEAIAKIETAKEVIIKATGI